ncbi:M20 family metallopeptidase [Pseudomonas nabeulensis]|uniref:M20 family metallopeptidase n=1 Tax=Pseudomonas nabeulensis TaxID=2293833 RepID=UPI001930E3D6|nr:ArgE/DapE family deacylase [Pseudomonas nabeulensis]
MLQPHTSPLALERDIITAVETLRGQTVDWLSQLIEKPSLLGDEASAQTWVAEQFAALGLDVTDLVIDEAAIREHPGYSPSLISYDGRVNVIGHHRPKQARGRSLIFNGHIDVVPVGDASLWTRPPFEAWVDGDRLYGRGGADMKSGIIAYLIAFKALQNLGYAPAAEVILQSVVEEECTGNGALACLVAGYSADAAIITEPTNNGVMSCQMGVMWLTVEIEGHPAHAAVASEGFSAVDMAMKLFEALKQREAHWNEPDNRHHCYTHSHKPINFNLGKIEGGEWASSVPTRCRLDIRVGFYPGRTTEEVRSELEACIQDAFEAHPAHGDAQYRVRYQGFQAEGCEVDMNTPMVKSLQAAHLDVIGTNPGQFTFTGTTDARFFNLYGGIPATCYGATGGNIHGIDEWVSIDSVVDAAKVLAVFMARWCELEPLNPA